MKNLSIESQKFDYPKALHIVFFAIMFVSCMFNSSNARAATVIPSDYRLATATVRKKALDQFGRVFRRHNRVRRAERL